MTFVNFRNADLEARFKMRLKNPEGFKKAQNAEDIDGPVWVRRQDFPGCLDHLTAVQPDGAGTIVIPSLGISVPNSGIDCPHSNNKSHFA